MGYIPKDSKWFLADIIIEIKIENEPRNVVQTNIVLVRADSTEEAYAKAIELGKEGETSYKNSDNNIVSMIFRGLRELNVIHDELEHGAELAFEEEINVPEDKIQSWITPKEGLGVFKTIVGPKGKPNYMSASITEELLEKGVLPEDLK
jgi:hypothetical protein